MVRIIHKVILNPSMMLLTDGIRSNKKKMLLPTFSKWTYVWDNGITIKLFIKFLKERHILHRLYGKEYSDSVYSVDTFSYYPSLTSIPSLYIRFGANQENKGNYRITSKEDLIESQIWKFYILEHLDEYPAHCRYEINKYIRERIASNGWRGSEKVRELMEEHEIKIKCLGYDGIDY